MPAARQGVGYVRAAHEARQQAVPARDLLGGAAEQHHAVGRCQPHLRVEGEFALAGAKLQLDRAQRQSEPHDVAPDQINDRLHEVVARLGEQLITLRDQADPRRLWRPGRVGWRKLWIDQPEQMKLDLEAGLVVEASLGQARELVAIELARRERNRRAVGKIEITQQPAGAAALIIAAALARPRQYAKR